MRTFILLLVCLTSAHVYAQDNALVDSANEAKISADSIIRDGTDGLTKFIGNVNYNSDKMKLNNAQLIVFNQTTKELIATGWKSFSFDGELYVANSAEMKQLRYALGEKIAYLE